MRQRVRVRCCPTARGTCTQLPRKHLVPGVCSDDPTARNLLNDSLVPGDTVLALGISNTSCDKLAERLASRFEVESVAA